MPKIIEHLRSNLMASAREILQEEGYDALTIRRVAAQCDIAIGTTYNYFPSKDVLAATVMMDDWKNALQQLRRQCASAPSVLHGLRLVYDCIADYCHLYRNVWGQYSVPARTMPFVRSRHKMLVAQLGAEIEPLLEKYDCLFYSQLPAFLAQSLLTAATDPDTNFNDLIPFFRKLCEKV